MFSHQQVDVNIVILLVHVDTWVHFDKPCQYNAQNALIAAAIGGDLAILRYLVSHHGLDLTVTGIYMCFQYNFNYNNYR